jgi:S-(hydroxymethyl)glutathione dehydrogenase/alcohol dehydrogenase
MCLLGTFAPYTVVPVTSVVAIDDDIPLEVAALVGCAGYGSAVYTANVRPGETVVVIGVGGVGINAVQGARIAGAERIVAVDPVDLKREKALALGATHAAKDVDEAWELISEMTRGRMAEKAIITTNIAAGAHIGQALSLVGKGGVVVVTAVAHPTETTVDMSLFELTLFEKQVRGSLFGSANPHVDFPRILSLYRSGQLMLDELVTNTYSLNDINEGYQDLFDGLNIRGVILHES